MDIRSYPGGKGWVKTKYVSGILTFYDKDGIVIQQIDPINGKVCFGTSSVPMTFATAATDKNFVELNATSSSTGAGTVQGISIKLTNTGSLHYYDNAVYAKMYCKAQTRNPWVFSAELKFDSGYFIQGLGGAFYAYIDLPASEKETGTFAAINIDYNAPAGYIRHSPSQSKQMCLLGRVNLDGDSTAVAYLDAASVLFSLQGFTDSAGNVFKSGTSTASIGGTLRILIGTTPWYIMLSANAAT
jgi:hypothetical protein